MKIARSVCEAGLWPHGQSISLHNGFECEGCGTFIPDTDEYWFFSNKYGYRQRRSDIKYGMSPRGPVPPPEPVDPILQALLERFWG